MFFLAHKPVWISSNLVIKILKRVLGVKKIWFAWTLDPLASGLLIIWTEWSPRLFSYLDEYPKTYEVVFRLDGTTESYDCEKPVIPITLDDSTLQLITEAHLKTIINTHFLGFIDQVPPSYSAVWFGGQRAYDLARKWEEVSLKEVQRTIHSFEIVSYNWPNLHAIISVSHGTYIRSIARDLGKVLGTGGYITLLKRTQVGHVELSSGWIVHNDISYTPISHTALFPHIWIFDCTEAEKQHLKIGSTPIDTRMKNGLYFVEYEQSYWLIKVENWLAQPIKNIV